MPGLLSLRRILWFVSLLLFWMLPHAHAEGITSVSPSRISPGMLIDISGSGFGAAPYVGAQVCFSPAHCTTQSNFSTFVRSWSDTLIQMQVPYQELPAEGRISVVVARPGSTNLLYEGGGYSFTMGTPVVSSTNTQTVIPGVTELFIAGSNFQEFREGQSTLCVNDSCLADPKIGVNILSWSPTGISVRLPYLPGVSTFTLRIVTYDPLLATLPGASPLRIVEIPNMVYQIPPTPTITTLTPSDIYPGQTTVTLTGQGFGATYTPGKNQICFGERCMSDTNDIPAAGLEWSDTRISFRAPLWLMVEPTPVSVVSVRVLDPLSATYNFITAPTQVVIRPVPVLVELAPTMEMGSVYFLRGKNFGNTQGRVVLGGSPQPVISWTDTLITYYVNDSARTGPLYVETSASLRTQEVTVTVKANTLYSLDEFTRLMWYFGTLDVGTLWQKTTGNKDVIVAVIDSGIDFSHDELKDSSWVNTREIPGNGIDDEGNGFVDDVHGWDFVRNQPLTTPTNAHGTMVASVIGAKANNFQGLAGIAPGVRLMNLQVTSPKDASFDEDYITLAHAQKAIRYAVDNGADVINLSFASDSQEALYTDMLAYAYARDVLVVIAAGNDGKNLNTTRVSPICDDGLRPYALGVASTNAQGAVSAFSNTGSSCVDLYAPGEKLVVAGTGSSGKYLLAEGTSFAAPLVSGAAALLRSLHPDWNVAEVRAALLANGTLRNGLLHMQVGALATAQKPQVAFEPDFNASGVITNRTEVFTSDPVAPAPVPDKTTSPDSTSVAPTLSAPETGTKKEFSDVPSSSAFYIPITHLAAQGVISGYSDGTYRPLAAVNRAEFLKILLESKGISPTLGEYQDCFPDVGVQWFAPYVCYAKELGMVEGYPGSTTAEGVRLFRPDQTINKVEALKIILQVFEVPLARGRASFNDVIEGSWYYPYVTTAEQLSLLDERFVLNPGQAVSRGTMAQMMYRLELWKNAQ